MTNINQHITTGIANNQKCFAWLIDPDKMPAEEFAPKLEAIDISAVDFIFLGGSLLVEDNIEAYINIIRNKFQGSIILFPGSTNQINKHADGILLLSLISGRNPDFLIGRHVESAAILKQSGLEILPTGYILVDSGVQTTASYISNTFPIPHHKNDIAVSTALAGELLGLKYIFLDAGSGAVMPVSASMIHAVKRNISTPLIVGGGIKTAEQMRETYRAGADIIVIGNVLEGNQDLISEFIKVKEEFIKQ